MPRGAAVLMILSLFSSDSRLYRSPSRSCSCQSLRESTRKRRSISEEPSRILRCDIACLRCFSRRFENDAEGGVHEALNDDGLQKAGVGDRDIGKEEPERKGNGAVKDAQEA